MRRFFFCASLLPLVAALTISAPAQSSLGDLSRQNRKTSVPKQKHVITNDDLKPSRVPPEDKGEENGSTPDASAPSAEGNVAKVADPKAKATAPSQGELLASWKARINAKKQEIELLEREATVAEREEQMQQRDFYLDAGERLRNPRAFAEKQEKAKAEIESKRASLESAKQQLAEMLEQARKDGIPSSQLE
jgi:hypothetical protein